jgi:hypothetical protein
MAKRGGGSGRKYVRDSIGRFASKGYGGQTSGRGARLKAKGKKRDGGGAIVKPSRIGEAKNTISKSSSKRKVNASSRATDRQIARDVAARAKKKSVTANSARATGKLTRPVAQGNIRRTGGKLGPKNTIKAGPKSPRTKMNRAIDNVIKKGKALKGSADKLRGVKKQADALRGRMLKEDKGRLGKALSKPSVTDKRSRDYGGRLTKGARGQDPATGGKKSRAKRGDTAEANIPMKGRRGKQLDASISKAAKQVKAAETARLMKPKAQRKSERAAKAESKRQAAAATPKRVRSAESLRVSRAKRITKERSISLNPAGNTQKGAGRMAANAKRTQDRALAFYKGNAKPAAAKPAVAKVTRTGGRINAGRKASRKATSSVNKARSEERAARFDVSNKNKMAPFSSPKRQKQNQRLNDAVNEVDSRIQTRRNIRAQFPVNRKTPSLKAGKISSTIKKARATKAQKGRATANKERSLDSRGNIRGGKNRKTYRTSMKAAEFYSNPAKALKGIKKEVGYKAPRSLRKGVKQTPVKRPTVNSAKRAPDNARTRANRLKTTQAKVKYLRAEPDSSAFKSAVKQRDAALKARPAGTAGKVTFRSKARAASRFQQRANDVTGRVRMAIKYDKTKSLRATGGGGGKGARIRDTGASQTSLFGKPAPLRRASKVSVIKRRTGKRRFS